MKLTIVGTGIKLASHLTIEAKGHIEHAEYVYYLVNSELVEYWIKELRSDAISLAHHYKANVLRPNIYEDIANEISQCVSKGHNVCVIFYGHPSVFVSPTNLLVNKAQSMGFSIQILPGISAEDCLFADLQIDPGYYGCQSFDATDFLIRPRKFDVHSALILWQVGVIGKITPQSWTDTTPNLPVLTDYLEDFYPPQHQVILYSAAQLPITHPEIYSFALELLRTEERVTNISTLYVPPLCQAALDSEMLNKLGLAE